MSACNKDVHTALTNVCFEGKIGHHADVARCLLMTLSGPTRRGTSWPEPSAPLPTREGLTESRRVHEDSVDAILTRRVWVGFGGLFGELVGAVYAPTLRVAEEEALGGRVAERNSCPPSQRRTRSETHRMIVGCRHCRPCSRQASVCHPRVCPSPARTGPSRQRTRRTRQ